MGVGKDREEEYNRHRSCGESYVLAHRHEFTGGENRRRSRSSPKDTSKYRKRHRRLWASERVQRRILEPASFADSYMKKRVQADNTDVGWWTPNRHRQQALGCGDGAAEERTSESTKRHLLVSGGTQGKKQREDNADSTKDRVRKHTPRRSSYFSRSGANYRTGLETRQDYRGYELKVRGGLREKEETQGGHRELPVGDAKEKNTFNNENKIRALLKEEKTRPNALGGQEARCKNSLEKTEATVAECIA
ncbi:hypothetical protein GOBAR_DD34743 [Gossypium barbadense]|nr:hypothetical protein GOBAR_DD34743 [Gossypium barbadense]